MPSLKLGINAGVVGVMQQLMRTKGSCFYQTQKDQLLATGPFAFRVRLLVEYARSGRSRGAQRGSYCALRVRFLHT